MNIYNQVANYTQCKKLKELGIEQKTAFRYDVFQELLYNSNSGIQHKIADSSCAAFTVAELGQMLGRFARNTSSMSDDGNEAIDRADDLIHLLEIGELLVDTCNERLNEI